MIFRRLLMPGKRLVLCCAIFIFVFFVCMEIPHDIYSGAAACAAIAGAIVCLAIAGSERPMLKSVAFFLIFAVLGIITAITAKYVYYYPSLSFLEKYEGKECTVVLRVDKTDSQGDSYANYNCSVLMCEDEKIQSTFGVYPSLRLNCFGGDFADKGDIIRLKAKIEVPERKTKDDFEEANYLKARHIFMLCDYSGKMQSLVKGEKTFIDGIREKLSQNITRYVGGSTVTDETVISKCMLLGDKNGSYKRAQGCLPYRRNLTCAQRFGTSSFHTLHGIFPAYGASQKDCQEKVRICGDDFLLLCICIYAACGFYAIYNACRLYAYIYQPLFRIFLLQKTVGYRKGGYYYGGKTCDQRGQYGL